MVVTQPRAQPRGFQCSNPANAAQARAGTDVAWQRGNFAKRKREKTTGKQRNGLKSRNVDSVYEDVIQVTPRAQDA